MKEELKDYAIIIGVCAIMSILFIMFAHYGFNVLDTKL